MGFLVYSKTKFRKKESLVFSILAWACAGWIFSGFMTYLHHGDPFMVFWAKMSFSTAGVICFAFLAFAILFPGDRIPLTYTKLFLLALPALFFLVISFSTKQIVSSVGSGSKMFNYGSLYPLFSIYLIAYFLSGFFFFFRTYRGSVGIERLQIKYVLLSMFFTVSIGVTANLFLPMAGIATFNWLGPTSTVILVGGTTYSIIKHRLMDINLVLKKGTTFFLLSVGLFMPSALLLIYVQNLYFHQISYYFSIIVLLIVFILTVIYNKVKTSTEKVVEQLLFKNRYDYRETLGEFSKAMVSILDLQSLSKKIIETITNTMGVQKASLFLLNEEKGGYDLLESNKVDVELSPSGLPKGDPLPSYLQRMKEVLLREDLVKGAHRQELNQILQSMSRLEAEVSIPLISKGSLIGIINLGHRFANEIYSRTKILSCSVCWQTRRPSPLRTRGSTKI